jgi:thiol-disulfide isomerase/thioredoxin
MKNIKHTIILLLALSLMTGVVSAQAPEAAGKVLDEACRQAAKEKKNVMIVFHASWCGWCKKFEASVNDPSCRDYFNRSFIIKYLTVLESKDKKQLENPGANEMFEQNGGKGGGIPYFLIYDSTGKLLADSKMEVKAANGEVKRSNMGCPAADAEIAAFIDILRKASKVNATEAEAITKRFAQNKN